MSTTIRERLEPLVDEEDLNNLDDFMDFFTKARTVQEFRQAISDSKSEWGASYNQIVGPIFKKLYQQDELMRNNVNEQMLVLDVPEEAIVEYFTKYCDKGNLGVRFGIGEILPEDKKQSFLDLSNKLMLTSIREYLGLNE